MIWGDDSGPEEGLWASVKLPVKSPSPPATFRMEETALETAVNFPTDQFQVPIGPSCFSGGLTKEWDRENIAILRARY